MSEVTERTVLSAREQLETLQGVQSLNMRHIERMVSSYLAGETIYREPQYEAVIKAAIELQRAYRERGVQRYDPTAPVPAYAGSEEEAYARAKGVLGGGYPTRGVSFGIKREQIPHHAGLGEYVVIEYRFLSKMAMNAGFVKDVFTFPRGKAWIIRLTDSRDGLNIRPGGWRYATLWAPNGGGMAGFL